MTTRKFNRYRLRTKSSGLQPNKVAQRTEKRNIVATWRQGARESPGGLSQPSALQRSEKHVRQLLTTSIFSCSVYGGARSQQPARNCLAREC
jgi:hypothetical protein